MLFTGGLNGMGLSSNFAVGKSAGPKTKLANIGEATEPDNINSIEAQGPVEAVNDFQQELDSKVENVAEEVPENQGENPTDEPTAADEPNTDGSNTADEPNTEQVEDVSGEGVEASKFKHGWKAQIQLTETQGPHQPRQNAIERLNYLLGHNLADGHGKASDAVSAVHAKLSAKGQPNVAVSEETAEVPEPEGMVLNNKTEMSTDAGLAVEIKTEPTAQSDMTGTDTTVQQQQQITQDATVELKPEGQISIDQTIKESFEQSIGKDAEDTQSDSKNISLTTEVQVPNNSVSNNIDTTISDAEAGSQQSDTGEADKEAVKTTLQQEFNNNLNAQINNQASANENVTEQVMPLGDSVVIEPKTQLVEAEQNDTSVVLNNIAERTGEQIQSAISSSLNKGESEITVQLNPPELGRVFIKFQQEGEQVTGLLEFSKTETRLEVEQLLPQLVRGLQDAGIAVKKLDVVQTQIENSGHQQFREHAAGDGAAYQQQFGQRQPDNYSLVYDRPSAEPIYSGAEFLSESPEVTSAYISDQSVNILV